MPSFLLVVGGGKKHIDSVISTQDAQLVKLLIEILPQHGYVVVLRKAGSKDVTFGPKHN